MPEVRFAGEAEEEYIEAVSWYRERSKRAAIRFVAAVAEVIDRIRESPDQFPTCEQAGFRFAIVNKYPYSVIYRIKAGVIEIVAIAHSRRRPGYWRRR